MKTDVIILLDRSGSMCTIHEHTVQAINNFIKEQREVDSNVQFSMYQFDDAETAQKNEEDFPYVVFRNDPYPIFASKDFNPRGWTALCDAACITIDKVGERYSKMKESKRPDKVAFVIVTDGYENSSKKYNKLDMKTRVQHQESKYNWRFFYLGANQDAITEGLSMGIASHNSNTYTPDAEGVTRGYELTSSLLATYRAEKQ